jgi:outer membrane protein OmpA-like peptidoglycan-associated protein
MSIVAYGESESLASPGDQDHYALERRVKIELLRGGDEQRVAAVELR